METEWVVGAGVDAATGRPDVVASGGEAGVVEPGGAGRLGGWYSWTTTSRIWVVFL